MSFLHMGYLRSSFFSWLLSLLAIIIPLSFLHERCFRLSSLISRVQLVLVNGLDPCIIRCMYSFACPIELILIQRVAKSNPIQFTRTSPCSMLNKPQKGSASKE